MEAEDITEPESSKPRAKRQTTPRQTRPMGHASLAEAISEFQAEMPVVRKRSKATVAEYGGSERTYGWADLADITKVAMPLIGKHGMSFVTKPTLNSEHGFVLEYELKHVSGESIAGIYPLKPRETPEQQQGSAITYARRYTMCAVLGIAPEGDDDDAAAADAYSRSPERAAAEDDIEQSAVLTAAQEWLDRIGAAETQEGLTDIYTEANKRGEASAPVMRALKERKEAVKNGVQPTEPIREPGGGTSTYEYAPEH